MLPSGPKLSLMTKMLYSGTLPMLATVQVMLLVPPGATAEGEALAKTRIAVVTVIASTAIRSDQTSPWESSPATANCRVLFSSMSGLAWTTLNSPGSRSPNELSFAPSRVRTTSLNRSSPELVTRQLISASSPGAASIFSGMTFRLIPGLMALKSTLPLVVVSKPRPSIPLAVTLIQVLSFLL